MKKGKIIILVIFVAIISPISTIIGISFVKARIVRQEVVNSKSQISWWTETEIEDLASRNEEFGDKLIEGDIDGAVLIQNKILKKLDVIDDSLSGGITWCTTKSIAYNSDCEAYKNQLRSMFKQIRKGSELTLKYIREPKNEKMTNEFDELIESSEIIKENFSNETSIFMNKEYHGFIF